MNEKKEEVFEIEEENPTDDARPDSKLFDDIYDDDIDAINKYDDEHKLGTYDDDSDDELMLTEDMGFIYN